MKKIEAEALVRAHQFLYYVKCRPIWTDYEYDLFCREHGIHGGAGSDRAGDYSAMIKSLATKLELESLRT